MWSEAQKNFKQKGNITELEFLLLCASTAFLTNNRTRWDLKRSGSGEGNGNWLQYSCLENPKDRGAWRAIVIGVAKTQTWLSTSTTTTPCFLWNPNSIITITVSQLNLLSCSLLAGWYHTTAFINDISAAIFLKRHIETNMGSRFPGVTPLGKDLARSLFFGALGD